MDEQAGTLDEQSSDGQVETPSEQTTEGQEPGVGSRMLNVLFSPGDVFASVNRSVGHLDWLAPIIVSAVVSIIALHILGPTIASDERAVMEGIAARNPDMPEARREALLAQTTSDQSIVWTIVKGCLVPLAMAVVLALIFLAFTNFLFGGEATFKKSLAVTSLCSLVTIPSSIVSVPLALSMGSMMPQFGPGLLMPESMEGTLVGNVLAFTNLFMIWQAGLAAIGMGIVSGTGTKRPAVAIFILLAAYIVVQAWAMSAFLG